MNVSKSDWEEATKIIKQSVSQTSKNEQFRNMVIETLDMGFSALWDILKAIDERNNN